MTTTTRRGGTVAGVLAIAVGLVAAIVLWFVAESRRDDAIADLARAPVGCDTTLDFAEPGTYLVFVETIGDVGDVRGDCGVEGPFSVDETPDLAVEIVDPDGGQVELVDRDGDVTYDGSGASGRSRYEIEITTAGDHVMRVESDGTADDFVLAVGRDPGSGVGALRLVAGAVALLGIGLGIVLLARGRTPASAAGPPAGTAWSGPGPTGSPIGPLGPPPGGPPLGPPNAPPASGAPITPPANPPAPAPWGAPPPAPPPGSPPAPPPAGSASPWGAPAGASTGAGSPPEQSARRSPWAPDDDLETDDDDRSSS